MSLPSYFSLFVNLFSIIFKVSFWISSRDFLNSCSQKTSKFLIAIKDTTIAIKKDINSDAKITAIKTRISINSPSLHSFIFLLVFYSCYNHHKEVITIKRNLDLIRDILLKREDSNNYRIYDTDLTDKYHILDINYNIELLIDEAYIICDYTNAMYEDPHTRQKTPYKSHVIYRLTSKGHDYLDSVRDDSIYKKTKEKISSVGTTLALPLIREIAEALIKSQIGI